MFATRRISYGQTGAFSTIVQDYLEGAATLRPFYGAPPTVEGIRQTIKHKEQQKVNRELLATVLEVQYRQLPSSSAVQENISRLKQANTFTVCTAHQPNLFTGPLYFMYKIIHAIRLADALKLAMPQYYFVPVYYMGSEDADFAELNHTFVDGRKIEWKREQRGAVGRMRVDRTLTQLIGELEGQLGGEPFGREVIQLLRKSYTEGKTIQQATFELVHELYGAYGLVVLIPDQPQLKSVMQDVFLKELFDHPSAAIVQQTSQKLEAQYNVQAHPRDINLFYLKDDVRERIVRNGNGFTVLNTDITFSEEQMRTECTGHPERFSPNVILRGLFQETILPNVAFIGGGGELAYWLQLKDLFDHYGVVFPVLVLRNSFLVVEEKWQQLLEKTGLATEDLFQDVDALMKMLVSRQSGSAVSLNGNFEKAESLYEQIRTQASAVDATLSQHVAAIKSRSMKMLQELEKKMLRAEKRKYIDQQRQVEKIQQALFPNKGLQERVENFSSFYAKWGRKFIQALYDHSPVLEQQFTILTQQAQKKEPGSPR